MNAIDYQEPTRTHPAHNNNAPKAKAQATLTHIHERFGKKRAVRAAIRYINRQTGDERPAGKYEKNWCWYPAPSEKLSTACYRTPSRRFPSSYLDACKSVLHCAILEGEKDLLLVRRVVKSIREALQETDETVANAKAEADILRHLADATKRRKKLAGVNTPNPAEPPIPAIATA